MNCQTTGKIGLQGIELSHQSKAQCNAYDVVSKSSRTVILVTASINDDERGGQGHTSESLLHQSAM
jgi:hypothetical protein